jgi:hypothetical protein
MTARASAESPAKKKLLGRIAAAQRQADAAKKAAKLAKLGFRAAKEKFKSARRAAKKARKAVKVLKEELAALAANKTPRKRPAPKAPLKRRKRAPRQVVAAPPEPLPVENAPALPETTPDNPV